MVACTQVMALSAALKAAKRERMDLLPVAPHARPPVFRLGDASEAAKQARLRERDARKKEMENRRKTSMKEVGRCYRHAPLSAGGLPVCTYSFRQCHALQMLIRSANYPALWQGRLQPFLRHNP